MLWGSYGGGVTGTSLRACPPAAPSSLARSLCRPLATNAANTTGGSSRTARRGARRPAWPISARRRGRRGACGGVGLGVGAAAAVVPHDVQNLADDEDRVRTHRKLALLTATTRGRCVAPPSLHDPPGRRHDRCLHVAGSNEQNPAGATAASGRRGRTHGRRRNTAGGIRMLMRSDGGARPGTEDRRPGGQQAAPQDDAPQAYGAPQVYGALGHQPTRLLPAPSRRPTAEQQGGRCTRVASPVCCGLLADPRGRIPCARLAPRRPPGRPQPWPGHGLGSSARTAGGSNRGGDTAFISCSCGVSAAVGDGGGGRRR